MKTTPQRVFDIIKEALNQVPDEDGEPGYALGVDAELPVTITESSASFTIWVGRQDEAGTDSFKVVICSFSEPTPRKKRKPPKRKADKPNQTEGYMRVIRDMGRNRR